MRGWTKKWWLVCVLVGAAALILGWGLRCERQVAKCRANYAAQESRAYGFSVDGNAAEQDAINAACEPDSYFCRVFSGTNLPTWLLVFVGIGGIWAAVRTLATIEKQTEALRHQVAFAYRAYLEFIEPRKPLVNTARFPLINSGKLTAKILSIDVEIIIRDFTGSELYRDSRNVSPEEKEVPTGNPASYTIEVRWPANIENPDMVVMSVAVIYDTGFAETKTDTLSFLRVYSIRRHDWAKGYWGAEVDFTAAQKGQQHT